MLNSWLQAVMLELDGLKKNKLVGNQAREATRMLEQVQGHKMLLLQVRLMMLREVGWSRANDAA